MKQMRTSQERVEVSAHPSARQVQREEGAPRLVCSRNTDRQTLNREEHQDDPQSDRRIGFTYRDTKN